MLGPMNTVFRFLQYAKASPSIVVTLLGITIPVRPERAKALLSIFEIPLGRVMLVSFRQSMNALLPIALATLFYVP